MVEWETCDMECESRILARQLLLRLLLPKLLSRGLAVTYRFQPIALQTLGPMNASAVEFLSDLGRRISSYSGDEKAFILVSTFISRSAAL